MKKILIFLFLMVAIGMSGQDDKNQVKISQDSIVEIHGQSVGRLRPVVSDGFYQKSGTNGEYNRVLDTETGVKASDTARFLTASDTIPLSEKIYEYVDTVNVVAPKWYVDNKIGNPYYYENITFGTKYVGFTVGGYTSGENQALSDGDIRYVAVEVYESCNIAAIEFYQFTQGSYTADNFNGMKLYSISGTTGTEIGTTANLDNIWKGAAFTKQTASLTTPAAVTPGIYIVGMLYNSSSQTTAPALYITYGFNALHSHSNVPYFSYTSGNTALPASFNLSTATSSTRRPYLKLIKQ